MNAITSRLPSTLAGERARLGLRRIGVMNGVLGAALVGVGVASYLAVSATPSTNTPVRTATVTRGVVLSTVSATGSLAAPTQLSLNFQTSGVLASVDVKAGEHVHQGQVLGRIDSTSAQQAVQQAESSLASAQAQLETTLTGETPQQRAQDRVSVQQSQQSLANAKSSLAATKASNALDARTSAASLAQARQQLRVDLGQEQVDVAKQKADAATYPNAAAAAAAVAADKARVAADQAKQQYDTQTQYDAQHQQTLDRQALQQATNAADVARYTAAVNNDQNTIDALQKTLSADGYQTNQDQAQLSADEAAQSALQSDASAIKSDEAKIAQDHNSITNTSSTAASTRLRDAQNLASAQQNVTSAQLGLRSTLAGIAAKQAPPTPAALASARGTVLQAQISLANARKTLGQTVLRAPASGVVAAVNGAVGTSVSGGGSTSTSASASSSSSSSSNSSGGSGTPFISLTNLSQMELVAGFAETDAVKLQPGQAATVTVDALPNTELAAHVLSVAQTSTSSSGVVTYNVTFALDRNEPGLKPGMTANVDVITAEADNVLHVPTAAVRGSGANATVTVLRKGKQVTVPVVAGLQGDSSTAILSGLTANETVVLPSVSVASSSGAGANTGSSTNGGAGGFGPRGGGAKSVFIGP